MVNVVLLGPQRLEPTLGDAVGSVLPETRAGSRPLVAAITAGWEEREEEDTELAGHLDARVTNLAVYQRVEQVFERDPELFEAMRSRHDRMRKLQEFYRLRLSHALEATRQLMAHNANGQDVELIADEVSAAIESVRDLDAHHLGRIQEIHGEFDARWKPAERAEVARQREELAAIMNDAEAVCVAGGHVAILLNRMRLFDVPSLIGDRPIVCWSAGAMALSERVVVFHDSPPQGAGNAEVLEAGLGVIRGIVPLPHAKSRLRLEDPVRVELFARRFGPAICVALERRTRIDWDGSGWTAQEGTKRLGVDGRLSEVQTP